MTRNGAHPRHSILRCAPAGLPIRFLATLAVPTLLILLGAATAWAGPPFLTDDPEPVEYRHWEVYIASQSSRGDGGTSGTAPHVEVNYGVVPEVQLHLIVPAAYADPRRGAGRYGLGDMELGVKYRFLRETRSRPQAGIFPLVELPTGDSSQGLGAGYARVFLPVWLQKSRGPWTTYGGGGLWFNEGGAGSRNYWQTGWEVQRDFSKKLTLGAELFDLSPSAKNADEETGFNVGGYFNFDRERHLLFSAGSDLSGPNDFFAYLAFQWSLGPNH